MTASIALEDAARLADRLAAQGVPGFPRIMPGWPTWEAIRRAAVLLLEPV